MTDMLRDVNDDYYVDLCWFLSSEKIQIDKQIDILWVKSIFFKYTSESYSYHNYKCN